MNTYHVVIDGSNVANSRRNSHKKAMIRNLEITIQYMDELMELFPMEYEILVDASLQYQIDDRAALDSLIKKGKINQCPAGRRADDYLLEFSQIDPLFTIIISNDRFKDKGFQPAHEHALCDFMIILDRLIIYKFRTLVESLKITTVQQEAATNSV